MEDSKDDNANDTPAQSDEEVLNESLSGDEGNGGVATQPKTDEAQSDDVATPEVDAEEPKAEPVESPESETSQAVATDESGNQAEVAVESQNSDEPTESESASADAKPEGEETISEAAESQPEEAASPSIAAEAAASSEGEDGGKKPNHEPHHSKGATMTIVLAILVAVVLIGLGYAAFLSENDDEDNAVETEMVDEAAPEVIDETVTPIESPDEVDAEIESLTNEIDSLTDEALGDEALTDESLGL